MGEEFSAQEIAKMAMDEALKKEKEMGANLFPAGMGARASPANFPPPPALSKPAFTLGRGQQIVEIHPGFGGGGPDGGLDLKRRLKRDGSCHNKRPSAFTPFASQVRCQFV